MTNPTPQTLLVVNGTPLDRETMSWITDIDLLETCDGADVLTLTCDAWDAIEARYRILDERGLFPGNEVELWAGYGQPDVCKGLFRILDREPDYSRQPKVVFKAYDGLQRLMEHTQARVIGGYKSDSDMLRMLCERVWGFACDVVPTPGVMPENANLAASYQRTTKGRKAVADTKEKTGDRVKPRGMTDLAWVKKMAEAYGWQYPKVRYKPTRPGESAEEVFVFRPAASAPDEWTQTLWVRKPGSPYGQLDSFRPRWSIANAPTGVQMVGWDHRTHRPIRVTARLSAASTDIKVTWDNDVEVGEKIGDRIKSGAALRLDVLGSSKKVAKLQATTLSGQKWSPEKEVPDVLTSTLVRSPSDQPNIEDLAELCRAWLEMRLSAWMTADWSMENVPGSHLFDSDQVHEVRGAAPMDEGHYILLSARHRWSPGRHSVSSHAQKLIETRDLDARTTTEVLA